MKTFKQNNISGGMVTIYPNEMKDSEFEVLKNMSYDKDKRLRSRGGFTPFAIPSPNGKPFTSVFFFQNDTNFKRYLLCVAGDVFYEYQENTNSWKTIKTGLQELESDGITRTRWSFAVYKNIVYMCDGVNSYAKYNGTTYTELTSQPKFRYLEYMNDTIFGAGEDGNPSTLYWSNTASTDANDLTQNVVVVGGDELGRVNGIKQLGGSVLVFKNKKVYSVDIVNKTSFPLDSQNGGYAHRSIQGVGNALFYQTDTGISNLQNRQSTIGAQGLESKSKTEKLRKFVDKIKPKSLNYSVSTYIPEFGNYYYSFDTTGNNTADTTLVYSAHLGVWTEYIFPSIYDYGFYIDSDGNYHYLIAPSNDGRLFEIENGFNDNGTPLEAEIKTKQYNFGEISLLKTFQQIDIAGLKSKKGKINIEILIDDEIVQTAEITDEILTDQAKTGLVLGSQPVGVYSLSSANKGVEEQEMYRYIVRVPMYHTGNNIQIRLTSNEDNFIWSYEGAAISLEAESFELFDSRFIL